jgi:hypothetical protein
MSYKVMKALIMNAGPRAGGCDNANSNENCNGEVGTFPTVLTGKSGEDHE